MIGGLGLVDYQMIRDISMKTVEMLMERGWTQHRGITPSGQVCVQGAMLCAFGMKPEHGPLGLVFPSLDYKINEPYYQVLEAFEEVNGERAWILNDRPGTTRQIMIKALRRLAEQAEIMMMRHGQDPGEVNKVQTQADHELAGGSPS